MCTALVVRDDYWRQQRRVTAELTGIDYEYLERLHTTLKEIAYEVGKAIRQVLDAFVEAFKKACVYLGDTVSGLAEMLGKLAEKMELDKDDDYFTVCDKFENRLLYLERKQSIQREQYYKNCFKLAKMNYNIQHHDRRC